MENNNNNNPFLFRPGHNFGLRQSFHPSRAQHGGWGAAALVLARTSNSRNRSPVKMIARLPCQAQDFHSLLPFGWNPIVKTLLLGTHGMPMTTTAAMTTTSSPWTLLRNHESTLLRKIYLYLANPYANHVRLTVPADLVKNSGTPSLPPPLFAFAQGVLPLPPPITEYRAIRGAGAFDEPRAPYHEQSLISPIPSVPSTNEPQTGYVAFARVGHVTFPLPNNRNVNMMPFILGNKESLPQDLQCYYPLIDACPFCVEDFGKVAYLTVKESMVEQGQTQRRPGLHIESPGATLSLCSFEPGYEPNRLARDRRSRWGRGRWGGGMSADTDRYEGGIYTASNIDDTLQVWDALVDCDNDVPNIVDAHGGCEHLRPLLNSSTKLPAGDLVWMTDCTPHEASPQSTTAFRQFFRLVMPDISHWYAQHSTANSNVPLPASVIVLEESKFKRQKFSD